MKIEDSLKGDNTMDYTKYIFKHFNASIRNSQLFRAIKTILNDMDNANYFDVKYDYHEIYRNLERIVSETFDDTPSYKWDLMKFYQDAENANYEEAYDWFIEDLCDVVNDITEEDYR